MTDDLDDRPLIVQSDRSVLAEVQNRNFDVARDYLALFAELVKSPEYIHTYRITPISLWNAAASGLTPDNILQFLARYGKYETPQNVGRDIHEIRAFRRHRSHLPPGAGRRPAPQGAPALPLRVLTTRQPAYDSQSSSAAPA